MRILAPEDYGLVALASASAGLLFVINELGLSASVIQQKTIDLSLLRQVFGVVISLNFVCFLILFLLAAPIATFYTQPKLVPLIQLLSCQFIFSAFSVLPTAILMRGMRFRALSLMDLAAQITGSLFTLFLALEGLGVWALAWGNLVSVVLKSVLYNAASPFLHWPSVPSPALRETMKFGGYVTLQRILWFVYSSADVFIVGKLLGKDLLGQYAISYQFASLPMQKVNGIISAVTFPAYSRARENPGALRSQLSKTIRLLSVIAFPIFAGISVVSQDAILVVLGEKWAPAVVSMQLLSLVMPLKMILSSIQTALNSAGRPDITFAIVIVATLVIPGASGRRTIGPERRRPWPGSLRFRAFSCSQWCRRGTAPVWHTRSLGLHVEACAGLRVDVRRGRRCKIAFQVPASPGRLAFLIGLGAVTYAVAVIVLAREDVTELRVLIAA
jgi:O-antigen/teichoic acid export membrane protein